jgi:hypothetical protein
LHNCISRPDMTQELVAQAFALRRPSHQSSNIDKGHRRWHDFVSLIQFSQLAQTCIRDGHNPRIRLNRCKRIISRQNIAARQRIKQRRLTNIGQPHNADAQAQNQPLLSLERVTDPI